MRNLEETFTYDDMNRLTGVTLKRPSGQDLQCSVTYDALGRMTSRQAVTSVNGTPQVTTVFSQPVFDATKVHAMASATTASGLFAEAQTATYTGFDKVSLVKQGKDSLCYAYGYDRQRILMEEQVGVTSRTKLYVGNCEFVTEDDGNTTVEYSHTFLTGPYGVFAVAKLKNGNTELYYVLKDNLGSWTAITDETGALKRELGYDAWGNLRNPQTWSGDFSGTPMFDRGFTGHEHLYNFGLINMNGRMYDPVVSSFLSVDQYVQSPENAQGFNRYAYCMNNPLKYIDPNGWRCIGGMVGYTPNTASNFDPYMFYGGNTPLVPRDLGIRQFDTTDPIITWMEENSLHSGGNGAKGGGNEGGFYINLASGLIEHHEGQTDLECLKQGLLFLAKNDASIEDVEKALSDYGFEYKKSTELGLLGGYVVDTQEAYQAWQLWKSIPLFAAFFSGIVTEEIFTCLSLIPQVNVKYSVASQKYDYFFGKVNSNSHNVARSIQNAKDLETLGITNKIKLNRIFERAITEGTVISTQTNKYGTTIMRRVEIGQYGCIDVDFFYSSKTTTYIPQVTTIIPKIYKP